jgi:hypothetical protein
MSNWTVTYGGVTSEYVYSFSDEGMEVTEIAPEPKPDIPWPCWDEHPISPEACMEAVRSFSRAGK